MYTRFIAFLLLVSTTTAFSADVCRQTGGRVEHPAISQFMQPPSIPTNAVCLSPDFWNSYKDSLVFPIQVSTPFESDTPCKTYDISRLEAYSRELAKSLDVCATSEGLETYAKTLQIIDFLVETRTSNDPTFKEALSEYWDESLYAPDASSCVLSPSYRLQQQVCTASSFSQDLDVSYDSTYGRQISLEASREIDALLSYQEDQVNIFEDTVTSLRSIDAMSYEEGERRYQRIFPYIESSVWVENLHDNALSQTLRFSRFDALETAKKLQAQFDVMSLQSERLVKYQQRYIPHSLSDFVFYWRLAEGASTIDIARSAERGFESFIRSVHSFENTAPLFCPYTLDF